ncbi:MAG: hypothetical protein HZB16_17220 [Armatimonadetes bacterium]|nr:hypothetical protein [Armatimonadota bacterium]
MRCAGLGLLLCALTCAAEAPPQAGYGRHGRLYVVPCPAPVTVDARLDEWDNSGRLLLDGPDQQRARLAAMWDAEALYLSGVVRDTTPLEADDGLTLWLDRGTPQRLTIEPGGPRTAFRLADDGLGYVFECRVPWSALGKPPLADASLAGALRMSWGPGQTACDVLNQPGAPEADPACWGRLIFCAHGRLPGELLGEALAPERPTPLRLRYVLPADGYATLQIRTEDGWHRRLVVAGQRRRLGQNVEPWDGCDDQGRPLAAGRYRWDGLYHLGITAEPLPEAPAVAAPVTDGQWRDPHSPQANYRLWARGEPAFGCWSDSGKLRWAVGDLLPWPACLARGYWLAGLAEPRGAADGFVGVANRGGPTRLFTADGLYVTTLARAGMLARPAADGPWYLLPVAAGGPSAVIDGLRSVTRLRGGLMVVGADEAKAARDAAGEWQTACARLRPWCIARGREALGRAEPVRRDFDAARGFVARAVVDGERLRLVVTLRGGDLSGPLELRLGERRLVVSRRDGQAQALIDGQPATVTLDWRATADGCQAEVDLRLESLGPLPKPGGLVRGDLSYTWAGERVAWASVGASDGTAGGWVTAE